MKYIIIVLACILGTAPILAQKGGGQNPGLSNTNIYPAPVTNVEENITLVFSIGNLGNGVIDGSSASRRIGFELQLSKLELRDKNSFGDGTRAFDVTYDEKTKKLTGIQKNGVALNAFDMVQFKLEVKYLGEASVTEQVNVGASAKIIIPADVDDLALNDNQLNVYTYLENSIIKGGSLHKTIVSKELGERIATEFKKRKNEFVENTIEVDGDSVQVDFYDNAQIDGDSISVFFNNELVAAYQRLSEKPLTFHLALQPGIEVNTLHMFANNLGSIPPNTALMVVSDGKNKYRVYMSSTLEKNGSIRILRKKNGIRTDQ